MKLEEVGLIALLLAIGIIAGFVGWTYIGPRLTASTTPAA